MHTQEIGPLNTQDIPLMIQVAIDPKTSIEDRVSCLTNAFILTGSAFNERVADLEHTITIYKRELKKAHENLELCTDHIVEVNVKLLDMTAELTDLKEDQNERVEKIIQKSIDTFQAKGHYHAATTTASFVGSSALMFFFPPSILFMPQITAKELENSISAYQFENKLRDMQKENPKCFGTKPKEVKENIQNLWIQEQK